MKVIKTTFDCDGIKEPCIIVASDDDSLQVRISTCYHYFGNNSLFVREIIDGDYNREDEIKGDFNKLTPSKAKSIAQRYSIYLK